MFIGLFRGNVLSKEMVSKMVKDCIIFVMVNFMLEISYEDVKEV